MKKLQALSWHAKRIAQKPFRRKLDKIALKKSNLLALSELGERRMAADTAEYNINRPSPELRTEEWEANFEKRFKRSPTHHERVSYYQKVMQLKTPAEFRAFAGVLNRYAQSVRAKRDEKRKQNNTIRAKAYDAELKSLRKQIGSALKKSREIEELESQYR